MPYLSFKKMNSFTFVILCVFAARCRASGHLLDDKEILLIDPSEDKTDPGVAIDELMPNGGGDEAAQKRSDFKKALAELMPSSSLEARVAPSKASGKLLDENEILQFIPPKDKTDSGLEIDELMPNGGSDENRGFQPQKRSHNDKTLAELMPSSSFSMEARFAPSDESFEHFAKKAVDEYTLEDVKEYERRNAIGKDKRWPLGVMPYEMSEEIRSNEEQKGQIYAAMKEWEEKTCVTFKPYSKQLASELGHEQRINLVDDQEGCWSQVGKQGDQWGAPQTVSLQPNDASGSGCMHARVVMHELGHALGFDHEQTRTDRDTFMDIYMGNVTDDKEHNFEMVKDSEGYLPVSTPYDYLSIMQYGKTSFGILNNNGEPQITMLPKDKCYTDLIGKARHLSYYDHKLMNTIYQCNKGCESLQCGTNCYATKSGENTKCHCVCLDDSNNPCKGGSCFQGDTSSGCAQGFKDKPDSLCYLNPKKCCETCKDWKADPDCPAGETIPNCAELFKNNPDDTCYRYKKECCKVCKGWVADPDCPGGETATNCAESFKDNPDGTCYRYKKECCKVCKGWVADPDCPAGDTLTGCTQGFKNDPDSLCHLNKEGCCKTCKGWKPDPDCPGGDSAPNCAPLFEAYGARLCAQHRQACCKTCKGVK